MPSGSKQPSAETAAANPGRRRSPFPPWAGIVLPAAALWGAALGLAAGVYFGSAAAGLAIGAGIGASIGLGLLAAAFVIAAKHV